MFIFIFITLRDYVFLFSEKQYYEQNVHVEVVTTYLIIKI